MAVLKASLITAFEAGFRDIPRAQMKKTFARFRSRLEAVLATEGCYFK